MFSERFFCRFLLLCPVVLIIAGIAFPAAGTEDQQQADPSNIKKIEHTTEDQQQAAPSNTIEIEEVVVTGTRIRDSNVYSSSQITTVDIEDISDRGITRVEDFLNDLPQVAPGQAITASNGASGTATVNLRNLGCNRTLVLINGQRLSPGTTGGGNCADLNSVPSLLLERIEVLTGGASSVYGSDAVAGVVNFIIDDEFQGFKASYTHSLYQHTNDNDEIRDLVRSFEYRLANKDITTGETNKYAVAFGGSCSRTVEISQVLSRKPTPTRFCRETTISLCVRLPEARAPVAVPQPSLRAAGQTLVATRHSDL